MYGGYPSNTYYGGNYATAAGTTAAGNTHTAASTNAYQDPSAMGAQTSMNTNVYGGYGGAAQQQQQQQQQTVYSNNANPYGTYGVGTQQQQQQQQSLYNASPSAAAAVPQYQAQPAQPQQYQQQPLQQQPQQQGYRMPEAPAAPNCSDGNGLRWTWSTYPTTEPTGESAGVSFAPLPASIVPLACMYTPLQPLEKPSQIVVGRDPLASARCSCGALLCAHNRRDEAGKFWDCLVCKKRNALPPRLDPAHPALTEETVEYVLPPEPHYSNDPRQMQAIEEMQRRFRSPAVMLLVDTCVSEEELSGLREHLLSCLEWIPKDALVGLITIGSHAQVWELDGGSKNGIARCCALRGDVEYEAAALASMLRLATTAAAMGKNPYVAPLGECHELLYSLINELVPDGATVAASKRPLRATGAALQAATRILESLYAALAGAGDGKAAGGAVPTSVPRKSGRVLLFIGGPCTRGPGRVAGTDKSQMMRFHRDIIEDSMEYYHTALAFYNKIGARLLAANCSLDVFSQSFDQVGVLEMRYCVNMTGGSIICGDSFAHPIFSNTLERFFEHNDYVERDEESGAVFPRQRLDLARLQPGDAVRGARAGLGVRLEVRTSPDTVATAILGNSLTGDAAIAGTGISCSGGNSKKDSKRVQTLVVSSMEQGETLAMLFDTATLAKRDSASASAAGAGAESIHGGVRFVQIITEYRALDGETRLRVTSVLHSIAPTAAPPSYYVDGMCLDQICAAAVLARMSVATLERHANKWDETRRWLDTLLVRFVRRYSTFTPSVPDSVVLHPSISLFPSFIFNLRRSEFFSTINISPDETTFKRHWLMRESVDNCILMIQPTLDSYDTERPYAEPVLLDSASLRHDNIVLMDAYFNVHIMWGATIFQWILAKYHEDPAYDYFTQLLEAAEGDAQAILQQRYPYPRFSRTDANGSEARHIKSRVNPSHTHQTGGAVGGRPDSSADADLIYTDDTNVKQFMEVLKKAVVTVVN